MNSSGAVVKEVNSIGITGSEDWHRLSITATVPETTANIRVYCLIRYASGTVWFDCLQLEEYISQSAGEYILEEMENE